MVESPVGRVFKVWRTLQKLGATSREQEVGVVAEELLASAGPRLWQLLPGRHGWFHSNTQF